MKALAHWMEEEGHTPKTRSWGRTGQVLRDYVREQKEAAHARMKEAAHV